MGIGGTANTLSGMRKKIRRRALRVLGAPPIPLMYDSEDKYKGPRGYWPSCQYSFRYESGNTKKGPEGIGGATNIPWVLNW